jgi:hypothetical protein
MIERNIQVVPTPKELAACFCEMNSTMQAIFFNEVATIAKTWKRDIGFQLSFVADSTSLTKEGRQIMSEIGGYAWQEEE